MTTKPPRILTLSFLLLPPSQALHYTYDDLNRLTKVTDPAGNPLHYHYDAGSNLLSVETAQPPLLTNLTPVAATPFPSRLKTPPPSPGLPTPTDSNP